MSLTLEQKTNLDGVPKAAELIEIAGAHALEASDCQSALEGDPLSASKRDPFGGFGSALPVGPEP